MKAVTKITFYDEQDEKFFGEGPCRLLHAIEAEGSLRAAASRTAGGKSGGGSTLTQEGKEWIEKYERYRDACIQANRKLYLEIFSR